MYAPLVFFQLQFCRTTLEGNTDRIFRRDSPYKLKAVSPRFGSAAGYYLGKGYFKRFFVCLEFRPYLSQGSKDTAPAVRKHDESLGGIVRKINPGYIRPIAQIVVKRVVAYLSADRDDKRRHVGQLFYLKEFL